MIRAASPKASCHPIAKISKVFALVIGASVLSSSASHGATLYPALVGDRWGFIDKSGNLVINPQFERAGPFASGLAEVRLGKWGYVGTSGNLVINPQFDEVAHFIGGLAAVKIGGRPGCLDTDGKYVINPQLEKAGPFADGLAR